MTWVPAERDHDPKTCLEQHVNTQGQHYHFECYLDRRLLDDIIHANALNIINADGEEL